MDTIWESLGQIPILLVGEELGLSIQGTKACCFTGHDSKPSLSFKIDKNYWHCFGCGKGGGPVNLVMDVLECPKGEAVRWLKNRFLSKKKFCKQQTTANNNLKVKRPVATGDFSPDPEVYQWIIDSFPLSDRGKIYLKSRKFNEKTIEKFRIGEILDIESCFQKACDKWGESRLRKAGLLSKKKRGLLWYRPLMLFPCFENEKVNFLMGRFFENPDFRWMGISGISKPLFNHDTLANLNVGDPVFICEGITDTMAATQLGYNAIGVLGSRSFNDKWVDRLLRFRVFVIPDNDLAGAGFSESITKAFKNRGVAVTVIKVEKGKDVADELKAISYA